MNVPAVRHAPVDSATALRRLSSLGIVPSGVSDDSRLVRPGDLFLAYPGDLTDGRCFIADAIDQGAVAVFWEAACAESIDFAWMEQSRPVTNFSITGLRHHRGPLAHAVYGYPSERLSLVAVTGTNGKTSVTQWIAATHPRRCAVVGTLGAGLPGDLKDTGLTTPEATTLMRYLASFADDNVHACALEASSIGIAEGRLDGARVDVAVFTNLTHDHLDYHGSFDAYAAAKARLFTWPRLRLAVCNLDDPFGREMAARTTATKVIGYTQEAISDHRQGTVYAEDVTDTLDGQRFLLCAPNGRAWVETGLLGRYNVSNLLAVAAVLIDAGLTPHDIAGHFARLDSPAGRLEKIGGHNEPLIVVDYAHTPDALENALTALRPITKARGAALVVVFGCGGDRDRGKRASMGACAARCADRVVLTSDNPRHEDAMAIIEDIFAGVANPEVIVDRGEAIRRTILSAHPADVVLIAGKGHETYQEWAGVRRPFSDAVEVRAALAIRRERT